MFEQIPSEREGRWQLMKSVIRDWMRPLTDADCVPTDMLDQAQTRLGHPLPRALREWYQLAGNAKDIWSWHDRLCLPTSLRVREEVLVFCIESQGIWRMGVRLSDLGEEDPPVVAWMNEAGVGPPEFAQLNSTLSEGALQYLAWVLRWANANSGFACSAAGCFARHGFYGWWAPETLAAIERECVPCGFPVWRLWGRDNLFFERPDLIVHVFREGLQGEKEMLYAAVRTKEALADFERIVRGTGFYWEGCRWYS
jgi:hypothetical protein